MKFGKSILIEIVELVREGISEGKDISNLLREIDVSVGDDSLELSPEYCSDHPRASDWEEIN